MVVIGNGVRYNVILLSDISYIYDYMNPYYWFDYNCIHVENLIECIEKDYNLKLVKIVEQKTFEATLIKSYKSMT